MNGAKGTISASEPSVHRMHHRANRSLRRKRGFVPASAPGTGEGTAESAVPCPAVNVSWEPTAPPLLRAAAAAGSSPAAVGRTTTTVEAADPLRTVVHRPFRTRTGEGRGRPSVPGLPGAPRPPYGWRGSHLK